MICLAPSTEQNPYNKQTMLCLCHTDKSLSHFFLLYYIVTLLSNIQILLAGFWRRHTSKGCSNGIPETKCCTLKIF